MAGKIFRKYGLIISLVLFINSCKNDESAFYDKIRSNDDCMIVCSIIHSNFQSIEVVMEKDKIIGLFEKYNQSINSESIINSLKEDRPVYVSETLYREFYTSQVIDQPRVDSLLKSDIEYVFFLNHKNEKILKPEILPDQTEMEDIYIIKRLFEQKILVRRDCESGYYFVIEII